MIGPACFHKLKLCKQAQWSAIPYWSHLHQHDCNDHIRWIQVLPSHFFSWLGQSRRASPLTRWQCSTCQQQQATRQIRRPKFSRRAMLFIDNAASPSTGSNHTRTSNFVFPKKGKNWIHLPRRQTLPLKIVAVRAASCSSQLCTG